MKIIGGEFVFEDGLDGLKRVFFVFCLVFLFYILSSVQFSSVQLLSRVRLFATP